MRDSDLIYPTHSCFDDALDLLVDLIKAEPGKAADFVLVHALLRESDHGQLYAHAWVECLSVERCLFVGIVDGQVQRFAAPKESFYALVRVEESRSYTYLQAAEENRKHGNYGPWIERYRELCSSKRTVWGKPR